MTKDQINIVPVTLESKINTSNVPESEPAPAGSLACQVKFMEMELSLYNGADKHITKNVWKEFVRYVGRFHQG